MSPNAEQELILLVGGLERGLADLNKQRDEDCKRQTKEHGENLSRLSSIEAKLTEIKNHGTHEAIDLRGDFETFLTDDFAPVAIATGVNTRWRYYLIGAYFLALALVTLGGIVLDHHHELHF